MDTPDRPGVAIINESMARRYWPDEDPIGQRLVPSAQLSDDQPESFEIVGIVGDVRERSVDVPGDPCMYFPYPQQTWPFMVFALKTSVGPHNLTAAVRREVAAVTKQEAAHSFRTMERYLADSVGPRRFPALLLGAFAGAALILATVGVYGTLSCSATQRTHEIGIRMALGARRSDVLRLVLKQGFALIAAGLGVGLIASLAGSRLLSSLLYEVGAADPATFLAASAALAVVALSACYVPARRAARIDPMVALRCE